MAVVVEDERGQLQVFSRGQPGMVLSRCSSVWDGDSIRPLSEPERKQLHACNASMAGNRCLEAVMHRRLCLPCTQCSHAPGLESRFGVRVLESIFGGRVLESIFGVHVVESIFGVHVLESIFGGRVLESTFGGRV
eukprot:scaffold5997_cov96-Isochrysis_galbana.AAC.1